MIGAASAPVGLTGFSVALGGSSEQGNASDQRDPGAVLLDLCVSWSGPSAKGQRTARSRDSGPRPSAFRRASSL